MVSNTSELLPEPDTPVTTVSWSWGSASEIFFKLCTRAPRMTIESGKVGYSLHYRSLEKSGSVQKTAAVVVSPLKTRLAMAAHAGSLSDLDLRDHATANAR